HQVEEEDMAEFEAFVRMARRHWLRVPWLRHMSEVPPDYTLWALFQGRIPGFALEYAHAWKVRHAAVGCCMAGAGTAARTGIANRDGGRQFTAGLQSGWFDAGCDGAVRELGADFFRRHRLRADKAGHRLPDGHVHDRNTRRDAIQRRQQAAV